jgi:hypothetical protein
MIYGRKGIRQGKSNGAKCSLAILALSLLASMPIRAQESTEQKPEESMPVSLQPAKLYTEEEALMTALAAAEKAVSVAVPLAVQAAVAEERCKAATQHKLDRDTAVAFHRQILIWRSATLVVTALGLGSLADGARGALYGVAWGSVAALVWWVVERWQSRKDASLTP